MNWMVAILIAIGVVLLGCIGIGSWIVWEAYHAPESSE